MLIDLLLLYLCAPVLFVSNPLEVIVTYSWVARDVIIFKNPKLKSHQSQLLSSSCMRGGKLTFVNKFSAQQLAHFKFQSYGAA